MELTRRGLAPPWMALSGSRREKMAFEVRCRSSHRPVTPNRRTTCGSMEKTTCTCPPWANSTQFRSLALAAGSQLSVVGSPSCGSRAWSAIARRLRSVVQSGTSDGPDVLSFHPATCCGFNGLATLKLTWRPAARASEALGL